MDYEIYQGRRFAVHIGRHLLRHPLFSFRSPLSLSLFPLPLIAAIKVDLVHYVPKSRFIRIFVIVTRHICYTRPRLGTSAPQRRYTPCVLLMSENWRILFAGLEHCLGETER